MSRRRTLCLRAFPSGWRRRYGDELIALLAEQGAAPWTADLDLLRAGLRERGRGLRPAALVRAGGLVSAVCALVALAPGVVAPATSTPHSRPTVLAAVIVARGASRPLRLTRAAPLALRGRPLVRTIVVGPSHVALRRARPVIVQPRLAVRAGT